METADVSETKLENRYKWKKTIMYIFRFVSYLHYVDKRCMQV